MESKKTIMCGICYNEKCETKFIKNYCKCVERVCSACFRMIKMNIDKYICPYCRSEEFKKLIKVINEFTYCIVCKQSYMNLRYLFSNGVKSDFVYSRCEPCRKPIAICQCGEPIRAKYKDNKNGYSTCFTCFFILTALYNTVLKYGTESDKIAMNNDCIAFKKDKKILDKYMKIYEKLTYEEKKKTWIID